MRWRRGSAEGPEESAGDRDELRLREQAERGEIESSRELGDLLAHRRRWEEAEQAYERADEGGDPRAAAMVGVFAESRGEIPAAHEAYSRADQRGDSLGAFKLGMLLAGAGDWDAAKEAWDRADERGHREEELELPTLIARRDAAGLARLRAFRGDSPVLANPVIVGAVTVLAVIIAVFLAYSANSGLPFVPTKELRAEFVSGSNIVVGNDVREGGFRIGLVSDMKPVQLPNGQVAAQLTLKLDQSNGGVPADSTAAIRPRSVLGLKYVDLEKGTSRKVIPDGGTLPMSHTSVPVQFDDIFKAFDQKTRLAIQTDLAGYGDTFTGRGASINDTISSLPELFRHLTPVAKYLSDPGTQLTRFFTSLNAFMGTVAPVAQVNARLFGDMATTFEAISRDPNALEQTIARSPSTLDVSTDSLKTQQPFLVDFTTLGRNLTPATSALKAALPVINPAVEAGTVTLKRSTILNAKLQQFMGALKNFAVAPGTNIALNGLVSTVTILNPTLRYLGPYVTVCDGWNYWWTYLSEHLSELNPFGTAQRALLNSADPAQPNNVNSQPASAPMNGGGSGISALGGDGTLHSQQYGAAVDNQGNADCETGQRGYPKKLNHFDPKGRNLAVDPHTPGDQGPTYHGLPRVPAGETFSRNPTTGPQLAYNPQNP